MPWLYASHSILPLPPPLNKLEVVSIPEVAGSALPINKILWYQAQHKEASDAMRLWKGIGDVSVCLTV